MVRWTSNSASTEPYIPSKGPHLFIIASSKSNCTTAQPQALHFPAFPSKGPTGCHAALEAFCWHAPAFVLFRFPLCHTEVTSIPVAFTERVRSKHTGAGVLGGPAGQNNKWHLVLTRDTKTWSKIDIPERFWSSQTGRSGRRQ